MFFKRTDNLPETLTSYDILKCLTVFFMLIDHVGAFFLLDESWWRVVGRLGFPAWFFLAGYSRTTQIEQKLWVGAGLLIAANIILGQYVLPMNALVSFIAIRVIMGRYYDAIFANFERLVYGVFMLVLISLPTNYLFEYGTLAFMMALFGFAVRNRDELGMSRFGHIFFCALMVSIVALTEAYLFDFNKIQSIVSFAEMALVGIILYHFRPMTFPTLTERLPNAVNSVIRFGGRYTLEIYVFHLIVIKIWQIWAHPDIYSFFAPTILPNINY